jgi:hypothetical protein
MAIRLKIEGKEVGRKATSKSRARIFSKESVVNAPSLLVVFPRFDVFVRGWEG